MNRLFYPALDALWMMERHGMTFVDYDGEKLDRAALLFIISNKFNDKAYPDPAGLALLEPRVGDLISCDGNFGVMREDGQFLAYQNAAGDTYWHLTKNKAVAVIQRNNLPFIMPTKEDAAITSIPEATVREF